MKEVLKAIENNKARLVGEGNWRKDSAYQVYEFEGKFYAIVIYDWQNKWLMDDTLIEIQESEITKYVEIS